MLIPFQDKGADANTKLNCGMLSDWVNQEKKIHNKTTFTLKTEIMHILILV